MFRRESFRHDKRGLAQQCLQKEMIIANFQLVEMDFNQSCYMRDIHLCTKLCCQNDKTTLTVQIKYDDC